MTQELDGSWEGVLVYGHQKGMQFGRDLVFTYGPLGFLAISSFAPTVAVMRIVFDAVVAFAIATGLGLVAWRMAPPWRVLVVGFFVIVSMPLHWGGSALLIDLGLFVWGLLCYLENSPRLPLFVAVLVGLAAVGALVKFTFLVTGLFTIGLIACELFLRGRRLLSVGMVTGFVLAFLLGWLLLGQNLSGLGAFLSASSAIAHGYNQAMGLTFDFNVTLLILLMTALTLGAAMFRCAAMPVTGGGNPALRRGLLLAWMAGLLFVNWKYLSVRMDHGHLPMLFGYLPVVAICLEAIPGMNSRVTFLSRAASLLCLLTAFLLLPLKINAHFFPFHGVKEAYWSLSRSLGVILSPAEYLREKTEDFRFRQKLEQLPGIRAKVGAASVDVFGQNQGCALANELNYHPRPVIQSYSAYSRRLMELNEQFYLSDAAPEYVLLHLDPIDHRFTPLEDALVLRHLLLNYPLVFREGDFLLLHRNEKAKARLTPLKEGAVNVGEKIDLRDWPGANLWLEIELQPTPAGRVRQLVYKPSPVQLMVPSPTNTAVAVKFNAPASMLAAGFLASPMLLQDADVLKLCTGGQVFRPEWYAIEADREPLSAWQPQIHYRIYRIENPIGSSARETTQ